VATIFITETLRKTGRNSIPASRRLGGSKGTARQFAVLTCREQSVSLQLYSPPGYRRPDSGGRKSAPGENDEPAIRKCYRKEMQITIKSAAKAKVYVIENEVVREEKGQKNRGLPKYAGESGLVIENKGK